jgi:hypothetical protein
MGALTRAIQGLILFSTLLGVFFLWQVYPLLPTDVFVFVATGWVLFVVDSVLTFLRPRVSYYLGLVLAVLALGATLSQPEHYALVEGGNLAATATIVLGSIAQALLITLVVLYLVLERRKDPWAWPGAESQV